MIGNHVLMGPYRPSMDPLMNPLMNPSSNLFRVQRVEEWQRERASERESDRAREPAERERAELKSSRMQILASTFSDLKHPKMHINPTRYKTVSREREREREIVARARI